MPLEYTVHLVRETDDGYECVPRRGGYRPQKADFISKKGDDGLPVLYNPLPVKFGTAKRDWGLVTHALIMDEIKTRKSYLWGLITTTVIDYKPLFRMRLSIRKFIRKKDSANFSAGVLEITCMSNIEEVRSKAL